jgi:hypothetical protein
VKLILGEGRQRGKRDEDDGELLHDGASSWSECRRLGDTFDAITISSNVNSIRSVDTALTSGVTATLIIE